LINYFAETVHLQQEVLHPQLMGQRQSLPHPPPNTKLNSFENGTFLNIHEFNILPPVAQIQAEFWHGAPSGPHLHPLPQVHLPEH
jgi:hypothetical protein